MRLRTTIVIAAAAGAAALLGGCGSNDEGQQIPASTRQELEKQLSSIEARFDFGGGACSDIAQNQDSVNATLDGLPKDVDSDVRDAVRDGFDRLFQLTAEQCDEQKGQQTETEPAPTTPAPAPQTETTPTTPTQTEETKPKEEEKEKKKGKGQGNNGGKGATGIVPEAGGGGGAVAPGEG